MMGLAKMAPDGWAYYAREIAAGVEDYFAGHLEEKGRWVGRGAEALGLSGEADPDALSRLFGHGLHPITGTSLGRPFGSDSKTVAGYALSFTPRGQIIGYLFGGAAIPAIWLIALGAWLAVRLGATDALVGLQTAGNNLISHLGGVTGFLSAVALAASMSMNAYSGMLTTLAGVDAFRTVNPTRSARMLTILALTVIWFVIAELTTTSAVAVLNTVLVLLLYLFVPWTVTNMVDFFFVRRGRYAITEIFRPSGIYGVWSYRGLIAYGVGFAVEIPFMVLPPYYTGPLAQDLNGVDISWAVGAVVTAIVYLLLTRNLDLAAEQAAIERSDTELRRMKASA
jgi:purine-cytosine permease-like protein